MSKMIHLDWEFRPLGHMSPSITTRPGIPIQNIELPIWIIYVLSERLLNYLLNQQLQMVDQFWIKHFHVNCTKMNFAFTWRVININLLAVSNLTIDWVRTVTCFLALDWFDEQQLPLLCDVYIGPGFAVSEPMLLLQQQKQKMKASGF